MPAKVGMCLDAVSKNEERTADWTAWEHEMKEQLERHGAILTRCGVALRHWQSAAERCAAGMPACCAARHRKAWEVWAADAERRMEEECAARDADGYLAAFRAVTDGGRELPEKGPYSNRGFWHYERASNRGQGAFEEAFRELDRRHGRLLEGHDDVAAEHERLAAEAQAERAALLGVDAKPAQRTKERVKANV